MTDTIRKTITYIYTAISAVAIVLSFAVIYSDKAGQVPTIEADSLQQNIQPNQVEPVKLSEPFIEATSNFSIELFKQVNKNEENVLLSPTSIYLTLGMTANGAADNTLKQFETLLGGDKLILTELNHYYYSLTNKLKNISSGTMNLANSIWYRDDKSLQIEEAFIQSNVDYYGASTYKADFNSDQSITDINNWVRMNTDGLIDKIIDQINEDTMMYLMNTVLFEAEWDRIYRTDQIRAQSFAIDDSSEITVDYMYSDEFGYLQDDHAQGFVKPYKRESPYSFVAMLPDKGVELQEYVKSMSGDKWLSLMKGKTDEIVAVAIPKFKIAYEASLTEPLQAMGLTDGFSESKANFNRMGHSDQGNMYIGDVLHKAYIQVDERGTKAGAVTMGEIASESAVVNQKRVILDRPFLYAIIENKTSLPIFIGTVTNPAETKS